MTNFIESIVEEAALAWAKALGYTVLQGPDIAAGEPGAHRSELLRRDAGAQLRGAPMPMAKLSSPWGA